MTDEATATDNVVTMPDPAPTPATDNVPQNEPQTQQAAWNPPPAPAPSQPPPGGGTSGPPPAPAPPDVATVLADTGTDLHQLATDAAHEFANLSTEGRADFGRLLRDVENLRGESMPALKKFLGL